MGENYITCREENGSINISEEVITSLVRSAISEVDGVAGLSNTAGAEFAELLGLKTVSRGVKVQFVDGSKIIVDAIITVLYGSNNVADARSVQEKLTLVQSTTGIDNAEINVHVSGVAFEK